MVTEGIEGLYIETRDYGATAAFWSALGFSKRFETDHGSGQWEHPGGGPYVFINERRQGDLEIHPILRTLDPVVGGLDQAFEVIEPSSPQHWGVLEAKVRDPDRRTVRLQTSAPTDRQASPN
jgi:hypothetical protein